jgi:hypothetical protein
VKGRFFYLICILFISSQLGFAQGTFQNNLLKTDIHKTSLNTIKLTLYTNKPYSDALHVNKKSDYEYVILLPETANSSTAKPSLASVSDTVKDIEIKTQQYQNQVKGYTKIIIHTKKAAEITPQSRVLAAPDIKLRDKDYNELLAQAEKSKQKKLNSKQQTVKIKTPQKNINKSEKQIVPQKQIIKTISTKNQQKSSKSVEKIKKAAEPAKTVVKPKTIETTPVKTVTTTPIPQTVEPQVVTPDLKPQQIATTAAQSAAPQKIRKIQKIKNIAKKCVKILQTNLYMAFGLLAVLFIVLLLGARKMTKNSQKQKEIFTSHLDEKPITPTDYTEQITEDMSWKEKFQTYVDATKESGEPPAPVPSDETVNIEELDDLFSDEPFEEPQIDETQSQPQEEKFETPQQTESSGFDEIQDYSLDEGEGDVEDLLNEDELEEVNIAEETETEIAGEEIAQNEGEETTEDDSELIKSEFVIDNEKGFYLVDFEDKTALVGHIEDEIFVLKTFDEKINAPIQARLNEKKGIAANYMTRVGGFKGIVEVKPDKMNLLIEL